jgi:2,4-dienoyl-CoA reductase-like NADH-dependent reductase (Old Yellow Enzyme family)
MSLTAPLTLARSGVVIRNRTVLAAMTNKQSAEDGTLSDAEIGWLLRRAEGGFGVVTTAATHVQPGGKGWNGEMGVWGDHHVPGLSRLAAGLRSRGAVSLAQIFHGGMRAPRSLTGAQPVSASENPGRDGAEGSRALTEAEIVSLIEDFGEAAARCDRAGFDGVEVHGAHGYLICQFLGEQTNRRSDRWGGGLTGRSRLLFEIVRSIRARTRPDFIVWVRISPQLHAMGVSLADSLALAPRIAAAGVDALHISCWDAFAGAPDEPDDPRTLTRRFRAVLPEGYPLVSTGGVWTEADAAFVLDEGADLVGVARVGIGHPDWPSHLGEGDYEPARPPFEPAHLRGAGLSEVFVDYMRRWSGFVTDGRG